MFEFNRVFVLLLISAFYAFVAVHAQTSVPVLTSCASRSNTSCEDCLKNVTCLWCQTNKQCLEYPVRTLLPPRSVCPLPEARWGLCWVNFQTLIIAMSVIAGILIISLFVCCFCCCKCENIGTKNDDARVERQDRVRKARQEERRTEMRLRHDEIRQKYGLTQGNPYSRMKDY